MRKRQSGNGGMKTVTFLCVSIFLGIRIPAAIPLQAQEMHYEASMGGEYLVTAYSFNSPHNAYGMNLDFSRWYQATANTGWAAMRHQPSFGVKANIALTPKSICGHRIGLDGLIRTPLSPWLDWELGLGVSTYTRSRYLVEDTNNVYITTLFTFLLEAGLVAHLGPYMNLGLRIVHSSNGRLHEPNRGLNYLQAGLSIDPAGTWSPANLKKVNVLRVADPHEVSVASSVGLVVSRHTLQSGYYPCYDFSFSYAYHASPVATYGATLDLWYNYSHTWQMEFYGDEWPIPLYVGALLFTEGYWGPMNFKLGLGYTLLASSLVKEPVYERVGVYYNFDSKYVGMAVNAHLGQIEFVEFTFGYRIRVRG